MFINQSAQHDEFTNEPNQLEKSMLVELFYVIVFLNQLFVLNDNLCKLFLLAPLGFEF